MSSIDVFLNKGFTPINKTVSVNGPDTISVWTPGTGSRVFVSDISIAANTASTVAFYFDTTTEYKIAEFCVGGSNTISPNIGGWESTVVSGKIFARTTPSATGGLRINLTGFELI